MLEHALIGAAIVAMARAFDGIANPTPDHRLRRRRLRRDIGIALRWLSHPFMRGRPKRGFGRGRL